LKTAMTVSGSSSTSHVDITYTVECTCRRIRTEKDCISPKKLVPLVIATDQVCTAFPDWDVSFVNWIFTPDRTLPTRNKPSLECPHKKTARDQSRNRSRETLTQCAKAFATMTQVSQTLLTFWDISSLTPGHHVDCKHFGAKLLRDKIGRHPKNHIGDSENCHCDVVLIPFHVQRLWHPCNFRIPCEMLDNINLFARLQDFSVAPNVRTVHKSDEEKTPENRDDSDIQFPKKPLLQGPVNGRPRWARIRCITVGRLQNTGLDAHRLFRCGWHNEYDASNEKSSENINIKWTTEEERSNREQGT